MKKSNDYCYIRLLNQISNLMTIVLNVFLNAYFNVQTGFYTQK